MIRSTLTLPLLAALITAGCGGGGSGGGVNEAPVIAAADDINATFDVMTELAVDAYDPNGDALSYAWQIDGAFVSDAETLSYTFPPGEHTVEVTVTDDEGLNTVAAFGVHVPVYKRMLRTDCFDAAGAIYVQEYYSYDIHGNLLNTLYDYGGDGTFDRGISNTYNEKSELIRTESDSDGDGIADERTTYAYDADGRITVYRRDDGADGDIDGASYTYYASVSPMMSSRDLNLFPATRIEYDYDGDGVMELVVSFVYDSRGNVIRREEDSGGGTNYILTRTYDDSGILLHETVDSDGDGIPDIVKTGSHTGNVSYLYIDADNDGTVDSSSRTTWDERGHPLRKSADYDNDSTWDQEIVYTYDAQGRLLTYTNDMGADGDPERILTYTYDGSGNPLTYQVDSDGDGTAEDVETYAYDEEGNRILYAREDRDPEWNESCRYYYGGTYPTPTEHDYDRSAALLY